MNRRPIASSARYRFLGTLLIALFSGHASGQVALYDNVDVPLGDFERLFHPYDAQLLAQPFLTGQQNTTISSVTIPLGRYGSPSGELRFSIWDDDGGIPGQAIGEIGTITEVGELPLVGLLDEVLPSMTFHPNINGLAPNSKYYVVVDLTEVTSSNFAFENHVGNGALLSDFGTFGAGSLLGRPRGTQDWVDVSIFVGDPRYLQMSVTAVPEPSSSLLLLLGLTIGLFPLNLRNGRH